MSRQFERTEEGAASDWRSSDSRERFGCQKQQRDMKTFETVSNPKLLLFSHSPCCMLSLYCYHCILRSKIFDSSNLQLKSGWRQKNGDNYRRTRSSFIQNLWGLQLCIAVGFVAAVQVVDTVWMRRITFRNERNEWNVANTKQLHKQVGSVYIRKC